MAALLARILVIVMKDYGEFNMKINIKMEDCDFFVDEEKRTVVCKISNTRCLVEDFFDIGYFRKSRGVSVRIEPSRELYEKILMPDYFIGKAVCSKDDEWNEEAGCILAFNRAKYKLNTSFFKRAQKFIDEIDFTLGEMVGAANEYGMALEHGAERRIQHIKRIAPQYDVEE